MAYNGGTTFWECQTGDHVLPSSIFPITRLTYFSGRSKHLSHSRRYQLRPNHPQSRRLRLLPSTTTSPTSSSTNLPYKSQRCLRVPSSHRPRRLIEPEQGFRYLIFRNRFLNSLFHFQLRYPRLRRWQDLFSSLPLPNPGPAPNQLLHLQR